MTNDSHDQETELPEVENALPPVDFTTFVLSLSTNALTSMGMAPPEMGVAEQIDLPFARHNIDLLVLLHEKTKGNLTGAEERLIDRLLVDLKLKFVEAVSRQKG